ncbi:MAG: bifunctional diaminohydroxyphosphoribosylaminopyrimidine deaminase/5-amino-6-(5-phosphoribosylamino)uracil reductase RibD [Bacteroidia bacterium]|nr:bifunctional diaminohydroxyphosphoribosylaminopyrimidine deaminase/5-amino-6-(5-phosphoribosylamino)uracil reductase RibD [Bacteroidia bacterium]
MNSHSSYLQRCLELARLGGSWVSPNPKVGAVVVHDEKIIGEGFHGHFGGPHAEVNAIQTVTDKNLLPNSTLYVSLEPCNHYGKTPPCTRLILENQIPRVVIGALDPNPLMSGKSVKFLRAEGVEVTVNEEISPFEELNQAFILNQKESRPWIVLKWAQSADGFIAGLDSNEKAQRTAISGPQAQKLTHRLRANLQAILVGKNTAEIDQPTLTTRKFPGPDPVRIIFDPKLELEASNLVFHKGNKIIVLNWSKEERVNHISWVKIPASNNGIAPLEPVLKKLFLQEKIGSILVEGGSNLLQQFIDQNLFDEIFLITSPRLLHRGIEAPHFRQEINWNQKLDFFGDQISIFRRF